MTKDWRDNLPSLPEVQDYISEVSENGDTIRKRTAPVFVVDPIDGNDPICFTDKYGSWYIVRGLAGGPYKRRM